MFLNLELCKLVQSLLNISTSTNIDGINNQYVNVGTKMLVTSILNKAKLGRIGFFLNGVKHSSKKALLAAIDTSNHRTFKVQFNTVNGGEFEVGCNVQSFKTFTTFERSVYCRRGAHHSVKFPLITK